ncbi:TolC family outer membrane protein [Halotalea alkalilenta]|nr:TolC family outer membrane protein [Halotalea alkalilenta]
MNGCRSGWFGPLPLLLALIAFALLQRVPNAMAVEPESVDFAMAYRMALVMDPTWLAARERSRADVEERALGRAGLLPNLSYRYSRARNWSEVRQDTAAGEITSDLDYSSYSSAFTLTQPLFDAAAYAQYREGQARAQAAGLTLERARQALAVRVLEAYTAVLYAEDQLALAETQRRSLEEDTLRAAAFVAGGEGTRTDQLEIEARLRVVEAEEIQAHDALLDARNALRVLTGAVLLDAPLARLNQSASLALDAERPLDQWQQLALKRNPELAAGRRLLEASRQQVKAARAGHLPSMRVYARRQLNDSSAENQVGQRYDTDSLGVEVNLPIYAGGRVSAASDQAQAELEEAIHRLDGTTRELLNDLERQYRTLLSSQRRSDAYAQAVSAASQRLEATRRSILGGERTNLDALDAERQRFESMRDFQRARYDQLLAWLSLRWQAGVLEQGDIDKVSALFASAG